ncbi:MAG: CPBP family intramembrane metalloprotease [Ardenticatenaceae bacterium]|nr:CPBP family intramembrane metalloprotease [Ardenticatenaceae bacterium]
MTSLTISSSKRTVAALAVIVMGTLGLLYLGALVPTLLPGLFSAQLVENAFVDERLKHQIVTLGLALLVMAAAYAAAPQTARRFYRLGRLNAPAAPVKWLDIKATDRWGKVGGTFAVIVSLATGAFIYFNVAQGQSLGVGNGRYLPYILLLAAMNAFTEEAITRLSLVTVLSGRVPRPTIYLASALLFGLPHYFGVPGGLLGSVMAGFLGWLLAKSVVETEGVFWAWFIHFWQDVIIFTGLFMQAF